MPASFIDAVRALGLAEPKVHQVTAAPSSLNFPTRISMQPSMPYKIAIVYSIRPTTPRPEDIGRQIVARGSVLANDSVAYNVVCRWQVGQFYDGSDVGQADSPEAREGMLLQVNLSHKNSVGGSVGPAREPQDRQWRIGVGSLEDTISVASGVATVFPSDETALFSEGVFITGFKGYQQNPFEIPFPPGVIIPRGRNVRVYARAPNGAAANSHANAEIVGLEYPTHIFTVTVQGKGGLAAHTFAASRSMIERGLPTWTPINDSDPLVMDVVNQHGRGNEVFGAEILTLQTDRQRMQSIEEMAHNFGAYSN